VGDIVVVGVLLGVEVLDVEGLCDGVDVVGDMVAPLSQEPTIVHFSRHKSPYDDDPGSNAKPPQS